MIFGLIAGYESGYFGLSKSMTIHVRDLASNKTLCGRRLNLWQFCSRARNPADLSYLTPWQACKTCRKQVTRATLARAEELSLT